MHKQNHLDQKTSKNIQMLKSNDTTGFLLEVETAGIRCGDQQLNHELTWQAPILVRQRGKLPVLNYC